jgi:CBS domain-containing protein
MPQAMQTATTDRPVRELMSTPLETVDPDTPADTVAAMLRQREIGSLVVTEGGAVTGIVTESDVVRSVGAGHDPTRLTAARLMSEDVTTVAPSDTVQTACDRMADAGVKRLPVVDSEPVGIVTTTDVAHELVQSLDDVLAAFD